MAKEITPTMEDYLEVIGQLGKKDEVVRVKNIARQLNVKMPSVTEALKTLAKDGLIRHEKYGYVELTQKGNRIAKEIYSRHQTLFKFLNQILRIDPRVAEEDACKMEHTISSTALKKLIEFIKSLESRPQRAKRLKKLDRD
ncbi:metal-dependent transcriptional regulator [Candidatus Aerophobetes bacterium]|uniref:Metal-dependent transcriptional regulator n=1 Tax=Aerophobetes bacterium TaxID=2030807 RepID=A0A523ULK4_UNCAE|nr:MAG: metal-dependent transcriptional regulator [Candidatus Aerophobetes bacterium]